MKILLIINNSSTIKNFLISELEKHFDSNITIITIGKKKSFLKVILSDFFYFLFSTIFKYSFNFENDYYFRKNRNIKNFRQFNNNELENYLINKKFDLTIISGTKKISDKIISISKYTLNIHNGYLPFYRGVSSTEWKIKNGDYNLISNSIHFVSSKIDKGNIICSEFIIPKFLENYKIFKKRLYFMGAKLLLKVVKKKIYLKNTVYQSDDYSYNFKHKDKNNLFADDIYKNLKSKNFKKYTANQQSNNYAITKLSKIYLNLNSHSADNGVYIFTYHNVCKDKDVEIFKRKKIPNIYTSEKNFTEHLEYIGNEFEVCNFDNLNKIINIDKIDNKYAFFSIDDGLKSSKFIINSLNKIKIKPLLFLNGLTLENKLLENHKELFFAINENEIGLESHDIYFNFQEILDLHNKNFIDVGNHAYSHNKFNILDNDLMEKEISINQANLEKLFGKINYFSFPYGKLQDTCPNAINIAKKYVENIFFNYGGINSSRSGKYKIFNRIGIKNLNKQEFINKITTQFIL